jgi:ubiquinone/menaquinone biosynthesis C-methylase UbiE
MPSNYNNSAWFYDALCRLVYGGAMVRAQVYLLQFIPPGSKILIVGGGTGWLLEELATIQDSGLEITYVEVAAKMMAKSQKRKTGANRVVFVTDAIENLDFPNEFDVVITPFLFDNFSEQTLGNVFRHIKGMLKIDGLWLNCDFQLTGKWWQAIMLKSMFLFFRLICRIEASKLPDINRQFSKHGFKAIEQQTFFGGFMASGVYKF